MLKYHVSILWNGNLCLDGTLTGAMVVDTVRMMGDNFAGRGAREMHANEMDAIRSFCFGPADTGAEHYALFGDETGMVSVRITAK